MPKKIRNAAGGGLSDQAEAPPRCVEERAGSDSQANTSTPYGNASAGNTGGVSWAEDEAGPATFPVGFRELSFLVRELFGFPLANAEAWLGHALRQVEHEEARPIDREDISAYDIVAVLGILTNMDVRAGTRTHRLL